MTEPPPKPEPTLPPSEADEQAIRYARRIAALDRARPNSSGLIRALAESFAELKAG